MPKKTPPPPPSKPQPGRKIPPAPPKPQRQVLPEHEDQPAEAAETFVTPTWPPTIVATVVAVPDLVLDDPEITPVQQLVLIALLRAARDRVRPMTLNAFGAALKPRRSATTIRQALKDLEAHGYVKRLYGPKRNEEVLIDLAPLLSRFSVPTDS